MGALAGSSDASDEYSDDGDAFRKAGWSDSGGGVGASVCDLGLNRG